VRPCGPSDAARALTDRWTAVGHRRGQHVGTSSPGLVERPSEHLRSEIAIVCGMANAMLPACGIDWNFFVADYSRIRDKIDAVFPDLFANFGERIHQRLNTSTGCAIFLAFPGLDEDCAVSEPGALRLTTLRSHDQYNTTIYGLDDRYRGAFGGRMVVFINETDMRAQELAPGTQVEIALLAGDGKKRIVCGFSVKPHNLPAGSIGAYYPETNPLLLLAHHDLESGTPAAKSIPVLVRSLSA
jgi:hypothetical protein